MSNVTLIKSVINYLENREFKFLRCLGEGSFGAVIAMRSPTNEHIAVKVVENHKIWAIEDEYWPLLRHANVLQLSSTMTIEELRVKLYITPIHLNVLFYTVFKNEFKSDSNSFIRVKKWCHQILSAVEFLHFSGLCHLDIKSDNVLLDNEDNAVLCDFSGLNFTSIPVKRVCSPLAFRPKECFPIRDKKYINGQSFDMWSFGFLVLNLLTDHYPQSHMIHLKNIKPDWETQVWPILEEALNEITFESQMKKAFPCVELSSRDVHEALHFVKFILNIDPEKRPNASRAKMHPFLKKDTNPFAKDIIEEFKSKTNGINPFSADVNAAELKNHGAIPKSKIAKDSTHIKNTDNLTNRGAENDATNVIQDNRKRKTFGKQVKKWFQKQYNKVFKEKKIKKPS